MEPNVRSKQGAEVLGQSVLGQDRVHMSASSLHMTVRLSLVHIGGEETGPKIYPLGQVSLAQKQWLKPRCRYQGGCVVYTPRELRSLGHVLKGSISWRFG